jgi:AcrR family transcriptional regulator
VTTSPDGPRFQRLDADRRRAEILAAATAAFAARPYPAVSLADVAQDAGVARGLINHYFGTKRDLYLEVVRQAATVPSGAVEDLPDGTVHERIDAAVDWYLDALETAGTTWIASADPQVMGRDPELEAILTDAENVTVDRVLEAVGLDADETHQDLLRALVRTYGHLARAAAREWLLQQTLTRPQVHTLLRTMLVSLVDEVVPQVLAEGG